MLLKRMALFIPKSPRTTPFVVQPAAGQAAQQGPADSEGRRFGEGQLVLSQLAKDGVEVEAGFLLQHGVLPRAIGGIGASVEVAEAVV